MSPLVSIIIVNWNGCAHLEECLDSLVAQTFRDFEVVLVDNGSTDGSESFVRERYPWVKLVPLGKNTGFATGNNCGFENSRGEYLVTLNNDTRVEPDWLATLVRVAEENPLAGMVGCRICSYFDLELIDSLGMGICPDGMSRGRYRNRRWPELDFPEVDEILFPSACAGLYKREMIDRIGFFDDDFFAYAEDSDLGLRGRLAGWGALLATKAVVYHKYSQSSGSLSPFKVFLVERNHYWAALKNFSPSALLKLPFFTLLRYLEQGRAVLHGAGTGSEFHAGGTRGALILALLKGIFSGLGGIPRMLGKRRKLSWGDYDQLLRRFQISFKELLDNS